MPRVACADARPPRRPSTTNNPTASPTDPRERLRGPSERVSGGRSPPGKELEATAAPRGEPHRERAEVAKTPEPARGRAGGAGIGQPRGGRAEVAGIGLIGSPRSARARQAALWASRRAPAPASAPGPPSGRTAGSGPA